MNTLEPRLVCVESVADLPVLWAVVQRLDLTALLDRHFPTPLHWKGPLTPSEVLAVWLLFILSESDHCLNHLEPWVAQHQHTISALLDKPIRPTDFHDDRLADWLNRLAADGVWAAFERELNQHTIRVYQLPTHTVRIDTTTANSYADVLSEQGLLQFGHSKDDPHRPQIKVAAAILDPLGMPLVTAVVAGNTADDPLYIPAIRAVRESLGKGGRTYVGDCKMAALNTRAFVASGGDFYLCPLSQLQLSAAKRRELLKPLWDGTQALESVYRPGKQEQAEEELVAQGFFVDVPLTASVDDADSSWVERRWLVRSQTYAIAQAQSLDRRLTKVEAALRELPTRKQGKKRLSEAELSKTATALLKREGLQDLMNFTLTAATTTATKRGYGKRAKKEETTVELSIAVERNETAIAERKRELGWQVYGTNGLEMKLSQVVWAYRGQYRIENDWSRLKGKSLSLTPMYLQDEERIQGLVYLLSLALRMLTLVEWVVREKLEQSGKKLRDLYDGQPGRQTARPSAELLLKAMKTISVSVVEVNGQTYALLSPLTEIQKELLALWDMPPDSYEKIRRKFREPSPSMSEP